MGFEFIEQGFVGGSGAVIEGAVRSEWSFDFQAGEDENASGPRFSILFHPIDFEPIFQGRSEDVDLLARVEFEFGGDGSRLVFGDVEPSLRVGSVAGFRGSEIVNPHGDGHGASVIVSRLCGEGYAVAAAALGRCGVEGAVGVKESGGQDHGVPFEPSAPDGVGVFCAVEDGGSVFVFVNDVAAFDCQREGFFGSVLVRREVGGGKGEPFSNFIETRGHGVIGEERAQIGSDVEQIVHGGFVFGAGHAPRWTSSVYRLA